MSRVHNEIMHRFWGSIQTEFFFSTLCAVNKSGALTLVLINPSLDLLSDPKTGTEFLFGFGMLNSS